MSRDQPAPKPDKCAVCESTENLGKWGPHDAGAPDSAFYPVCQSCVESDRHDRWRDKAIAELRGSNVAFVSLGNLAADYAELLSYQRSDARQQDGICPNGCARLEYPSPGESHCPACGFTGYHTTLHAPPTDA